MPITFEDLAAFAIDTEALPPMVNGRGKARKNDRTRTYSAKRESVQRRQAQHVKRVTVAA